MVLNEISQQLQDGFPIYFGTGLHVPHKMNCNNVDDP